jgi:hypothetical protein
MTLVLLPLTMYVVTYELAHGRPYSRFEELLLHSIHKPPRGTGCTFADIREVFQIHDRLLTEGLVTLIQEGWVAMEQRDGEIHYLVTEEGRLTIASGRRPSNLRVRTARASIVRERLTGQLARAADLGIVNGTRLRGTANRKVWKEALKPRMLRSAINGGEAERLLPRADERQEWIRWIDSVARVSQDLHYLPVRVDLDEGRVLGLPYQWQHLVSMILQEVEERSEEFRDDPKLQNEIRELVRTAATRNGRPEADEGETGTASFAVATITCMDVALTATESRDMAAQVLARCTGNALFVADRLDRKRASALRDVLISLLARGVQADLLWSSDESDEQIREILNVIGAARTKAALPATLTFNRVPSTISANLLVASTPQGPVAVVGSSFLEPDVADDALSPAARMSDPTILAALARLCAGWWEAAAGEDGPLPAHRWKYLAERWASEGAAPAAHASSALVANCPYGGTAACAGEIALLTGPREATIREEILTRAGPRFMAADGRSATEILGAEFTQTLPATVGSLYRAFGGIDGWRFLRRRSADPWAEQLEPELPKPSQLHRVLAARNQWLISRAGEPESALSFLLTGHVAVKAWERTSARAHSETPASMA